MFSGTCDYADHMFQARVACAGENGSERAGYGGTISQPGEIVVAPTVAASATDV